MLKILLPKKHQRLVLVLECTCPKSVFTLRILIEYVDSILATFFM